MAGNAPSVLDQWIEDLKRMGGVPAEVAQVVATEGLKFIRANVSAGVGPDGTPWPKKKDGSTALQAAGQGVTSAAAGPIAIFRLLPPWVYHHFGAGDNPVRRILPFGAMPAKLGNAVRQGIIPPWKKR